MSGLELDLGDGPHGTPRGTGGAGAAPAPAEAPVLGPHAGPDAGPEFGPEFGADGAATIDGGGMFVTLGADGDVFAAPVERVQEILDMRPIARLPRAPMNLLGMIDVRGRSVPVADLRGLLGLGHGADDQDTRILVLTLADGQVVGLKTDRVYEVAGLDHGRLERPDPSSGWRMDAVAGIGRREGRFVSVLDLDRLLSGEVAAFAEARG